MPGSPVSSGRVTLTAFTSWLSKHNGQVRVEYMYITAPASPIYHLAENGWSSLCGRIYILSLSDHRRRRDDWRIEDEKPDHQFTALCSECNRHVTGEEKPEPPPPELIPHYPRMDRIF